MVYKNGPGYKVRGVRDIKADILRARDIYGDHVRTLFLPAGNTIAMKTDDLCQILIFAKETFSTLERITVYGSSQYIHKKGPQRLKCLADAGLSRIHVGLESGDDIILKRIKKGTSGKEQIEAGRWVMDAGMELSPATIRNVMADLEDLGLVSSPHTSAGRIPTVTGFRMFVDSLLTVQDLKAREVEQIRSNLMTSSDPAEMLISASQLLSGVTHMAGVVTVPRREPSSFRQIEFLPLSNHRVLAILKPTREMEPGQSVVV